MYCPTYSVRPIKIALNIVPSCWQRATGVQQLILCRGSLKQHNNRWGLVCLFWDLGANCEYLPMSRRLLSPGLCVKSSFGVSALQRSQFCSFRLKEQGMMKK